MQCLFPDFYCNQNICLYLFFNISESEEANITAESLEILRQHKLVVKITSKLEKELQALKKKQEKVSTILLQNSVQLFIMVNYHNVFLDLIFINKTVNAVDFNTKGIYESNLFI